MLNNTACSNHSIGSHFIFIVSLQAARITRLAYAVAEAVLKPYIHTYGGGGLWECSLNKYNLASNSRTLINRLNAEWAKNSFHSPF